LLNPFCRLRIGGLQLGEEIIQLRSLAKGHPSAQDHRHKCRNDHVVKALPNFHNTKVTQRRRISSPVIAEWRDR
jgi:hypothetical protein